LTRRCLQDWLAWMTPERPSDVASGLDRVRSVAERMELVTPAASPAPVTPAAASAAAGRGPSSWPGARLATITVGGTNGKGSTCAFLERILIEAGYRTGLFTSPHLLEYNERIRIAGENAGDDAIVAAFERIDAARQATTLTYFEFGTLAAFEVFARHEVEVAILEVGLGGRLDAVNVVDTDCAIVASVDLDHQALLGSDRESIGFEKAGIFRPGRPAIFGDRDPPARLVEHARTIGADLMLLGRDFRYEAHEHQWDFLGRRGARRALPIPALRGRWQLRNASSALAALDELAGRIPVSLGEVKRGLTLVRLPGRMQVLPGRPTIVMDVAHNPHAARALADGLGDMGFYENTLAVFAVFSDKDVGGVIDAMRGRVDRWYVAASDSERAAPAAVVAEALSKRGLQTATRCFATVPSAFEAARREAGPNDRIVVFGSFTTVAEALRAAR
jgi:dihydrofolate synthase/folylpolyglutamate synthase